MNRQRNLTWIEKKQIEKIAFDHPFFDTHGTVLSKKEAKAIIRSTETRKSGIEIVSEACDRVGIPRPDSVDNRSSIFDNLKEIFSIPVARRIGIIAIALILLVVFFTATPAGRAIAESVIQYFTTLLDDGRVIISRNDHEQTSVLIDNEPTIAYDGEQDESDDLENYVFLNTFDDFTKATGKTPTVLPLPCKNIYYENDETLDLLQLFVTYESSEGTIAVLQIWNADELIASTTTGFAVYDANKALYYSIEDDEIIIGKALEDSYLTISAKGSFTLEDLVKMLEK